MKALELIEEAYKSKYAIGGFNFYNYESAKAIVDGAKKLNKPVFLMVSEKSIDYAGFDQIIEISKMLKKDSKTDFFLHLDHGSDLNLIKKCITSGFDSVMFDGSKLPLDQNIEISTSLRRDAHRKGVLFEAEIGHVGGVEDNVSSSVFKTNPSEALFFHEKVKPDILAVAIGNIHGVKTANELLDFSLLAKIQDTIKAPIVLHGCSNRLDREYQVAISEGVVKINIDTELRESFVEGIKSAINKRISDPREIMDISSQFMNKRAEQKIELFSKGCCSR